jgi:hypothetical protein
MRDVVNTMLGDLYNQSKGEEKTKSNAIPYSNNPSEAEAQNAE